VQRGDTSHRFGVFGAHASVYSERSVRVGAVTEDGRVYNVAGEHLGTVDPSGPVVTPQGMVVGWAAPSGHLADYTGLVLTQLRADGGVESFRRRYIGYVTPQLSLQLRAGAALLLLPVED
jgi:hypothetical protein